MTDKLSDEAREARQQRVLEGLRDRIQFYVWAEAGKQDVADLIDSLDEHGLALVEIPDWADAHDAQTAVDAALSRSCMGSEAADGQHPDCDICGQPFLEHEVTDTNTGSFRVCPVAAVTYRPPPPLLHGK